MGELATLVGTKRCHVSMWEDNKATPSGNFLVLIGIALNRSPQDFYDIEGLR